MSWEKTVCPAFIPHFDNRRRQRPPGACPGSAAIDFKSKNESYALSRAICDCYSERPDFSRTPLTPTIRAGSSPVAFATICLRKHRKRSPRP